MLARAVGLSALYAVGNVLQRAVSVFLVPLYTAWLSPGDYGVIALLTLSGALINVTIETPIASALNRFYYRPGYRERNGVLVFNLALVAGGLLAIVTCLYWLAAPLLASVLLDDAALLPAVRLYTAVLALSCTSTLLGLLLQLNEAGRHYLAASFASVIVGSGVSVVLLVGAGLGVMAMIAGQIAGHAAFTLLCLPALFQRARRQRSLEIVRTPLWFGCATLVSGYSMLLMQVGDRFAVRSLLTVGDVGLYAFGGTIAQLVTLLFGGPISSGTAPALRRLESEPDRLRAYVRRLTTWIWAVGLWIVLGLSAFSREIVMLLASNPAFYAAWAVIPILAVARLLHLAAGFTGWGITLGDRPGWTSALVMIMALVNLGLNLALIPLYGLAGAAVGTAAAYVLWNAANGWLSHRFYRLTFDWRRLAHAGVLAFGLGLLALLAGGLDSVWASLFVKAVLVAAYPAALWATRFATASEGDRLRQAAVRTWSRLRGGRERPAGPVDHLAGVPAEQ